MANGIQIRPATEDDQAIIRQMVSGEHLDPTSLKWQQFLIAEQDGQVVGIGQIRAYPNCRELGSMVVRREFRDQGVGGEIIRALLARETGTVYLECVDDMAAYYTRFGFVEIPFWTAPMPLRLKSALVNILRLLFLSRHRVVVMRRDRPDAAVDG